MTAQLGSYYDAQHLLAAMDYDRACEQRLWLTVIATTICDALAGDDELHSGSGASTSSRPRAIEREEARIALTASQHREEREALCVLADLQLGRLCALGRALKAKGWSAPSLRAGLRAVLAHGQKAQQMVVASAGVSAALGAPQARITRRGGSGGRR